MDKKGVIFILFAHDCLLVKYLIAICGFSDLDCEGYVGKEKWEGGVRRGFTSIT